MRVDFCEDEGKLLFGEMTFYHMGGFAEINPMEWTIKIGDWIKLPTDR